MESVTGLCNPLLLPGHCTSSEGKIRFTAVHYDFKLRNKTTPECLGPSCVSFHNFLYIEFSSKYEVYCLGLDSGISCSTQTTKQYQSLKKEIAAGLPPTQKKNGVNRKMLLCIHNHFLPFHRLMYTKAHNKNCLVLLATAEIQNERISLNPTQISCVEHQCFLHNGID